MSAQPPLSSNPVSSVPPSTENTTWSFPFLQAAEEEVGETSRLADKSDDLKEPLLQQPAAPAQLPSSHPAVDIQGSVHSEDDSEELSTSSMGAYQPFGDVSGHHTVVEFHEHSR